MKASWTFGIAGALLVSGAAAAQEARIDQVGPPPPTAEALAAPLRPDWLRMPTAQQMEMGYPKGTTKGIEATVTLRCMITDKGTVEACKVVEETPAGRGFGRAAVAASRYFQMRTTSLDKGPVSGREFVFEVRWRNAASYYPTAMP